jgi:hypothetical protein
MGGIATISIEDGLLLRVLQHIIGLADQLELLLCLFPHLITVVAVSIWVPHQSHLLVRLF